MKKLVIMIIANTILVLAAAALVVRSMGAPHSAAAPPAPTRTVAAAQATKPPTNIDDLVAPIALYPDSLLAQILMCASDPDNVKRLKQMLGDEIRKGCF